MTVQHGTLTRWSGGRYRCGCDGCMHRAARAAYRRARRALLRRDLAAVPPRAHGSASTYENYGCRCGPCSSASRAKSKAWREKRRAT